MKVGDLVKFKLHKDGLCGIILFVGKCDIIVLWQNGIQDTCRKQWCEVLSASG
jgi:hypothetical protein